MARSRASVTPWRSQWKSDAPRQKQEALDRSRSSRRARLGEESAGSARDSNPRTSPRRASPSPSLPGEPVSSRGSSQSKSATKSVEPSPPRPKHREGKKKKHKKHKGMAEETRQTICLRCHLAIPKGMSKHDVTMEPEGNQVYYQNCVFQLIDKDQNARVRDPTQEEILNRVADRLYEDMKQQPR